MPSSLLHERDVGKTGIHGVLCDHGRVLASIPWRFFMTSLTRRVFLQTTTAAAGAALFGSADAEERPKPTKKLAVVTTAYHYLSHAYHICGRFLYGYPRAGRMHYPDYAIAGMHVEQKKEGDLSVELSRKHGFTLYPDVAGALTLGGDKLAVDGVLLIGEHGDYPYNDKGQKLYPRYELFQKIIGVFRKSEKSVPVFNDKHLYYDHKKAADMVETARKFGFPLMAGSSLPVTWRRPELELPLGVEIKDALVVSRGEIEIYGIHALEALQCIVERRKTTKQGVKAVTCLEGEEVWKAGDDGVWSKEIFEAALSRSPSRNVGDPRENCKHYVPPAGRPSFPKDAVAIVVEYQDGLKATALLLNGHVEDTTFAAKIAGEKKPVSTLFYLPPPPGAAFLEALVVKIEDFLATGKPHCPVERTLLTGGVLDWALESRVRKHKRLETVDLAVEYEPPRDSGFMRGEHP
jgi:hypothetical protein